VEAGVDFTRQVGGFRTICLHTNARVPGAEAFWRSLPVTEIHDARGADPTQTAQFQTIHFELNL
jgi:hypothetical protein